MIEDEFQTRKKIIKWYMDNSSLSEDIDYQPNEIRLQLYSDFVNEMSQEELEEHNQMMIEENLI
jgi:hypothetical protein